MIEVVCLQVGPLSFSMCAICVDGNLSYWLTQEFEKERLTGYVEWIFFLPTWGFCDEKKL